MVQKTQKWMLANFDANQVLVYLLDGGVLPRLLFGLDLREEREMAFELFYEDKSFIADLESGFAWRAMNERILKNSKISENKFVNKE